MRSQGAALPLILVRCRPPIASIGVISHPLITGGVEELPGRADEAETAESVFGAQRPQSIYRLGTYCATCSLSCPLLLVLPGSGILLGGAHHIQCPFTPFQPHQYLYKVQSIVTRNIVKSYPSFVPLGIHRSGKGVVLFRRPWHRARTPIPHHSIPYRLFWCRNEVCHVQSDTCIGRRGLWWTLELLASRYGGL